MHSPCEVLRCFEIPLDELAIDDKLRGFVPDTACSPGFDLTLHRLETPLHAAHANRHGIHEAETLRMFWEHPGGNPRDKASALTWARPRQVPGIHPTDRNTLWTL